MNCPVMWRNNLHLYPNQFKLKIYVENLNLKWVAVLDFFRLQMYGFFLSFLKLTWNVNYPIGIVLFVSGRWSHIPVQRGISQDLLIADLEMSVS